MAISGSNITSGSNTTPGATYTTASVSVTSGQLYIVSLLLNDGTNGVTGVTVTLSGAGQGSWTSLASKLVGGSSTGIWTFWIIAASSTSGTLVFSFSGGSSNFPNKVFGLDTFTGINTTSPIVQSNTVATFAASGSVTLSSGLQGGSATFGAFVLNNANAGGTLTPGSGYSTLLANTVINTNQSLMTEYAATGSSPVTTAQWAAGGLNNYAGIGVEIAAFGAVTHNLSLAITSGQSVNLQRAIGKTSAILQAQGVALTRSIAHRIAVSSPQTLVLLKAIQKIIAVVSGELVSVIPAALRPKTITIASPQQVLIVAIHGIPLLLAVVSAQSVKLIRSITKLVSIAQTQTVLLRRSIGRTIAVVMAQSVVLMEALSKPIAVTQGQIVSLKRTTGKRLAITQAQAIAIRRAMSKTISVVSGETVTAFARHVRPILIAITMGQTVVLRANGIAGSAIAQTIRNAIVRVYTLRNAITRIFTISNTSGR